MPDLREELGRLADGVGEPVGLHDLSSARRRRERRRRAAGLVGGLVVVALVGAFAARTLSDAAPSAVPGDDASPNVSVESCVPKTGLTITGKDLTLNGCTVWPADTPIDVTLVIEDRDIAMGLSVFDAANCRIDACNGQPLWMMDPIVGKASGSGTIPALVTGHYVLVDPVHPRAQLYIQVGDVAWVPPPPSPPVRG
jgi:hypothetical protein